MPTFFRINQKRFIRTKKVGQQALPDFSLGYVAFNTNVRPSSKARIAELADEMVISPREVLDYLLFFFDCKLQEQVSPNQNQLAAAIEALRAQQAELVKHLNSVGISLPSARNCSQP